MSYLIDTIEAQKGAFDSVLVMIRNGWSKLRDFLPLLTKKGISLIAGWLFAWLVKEVYVIKIKKKDPRIVKITFNIRTKCKSLLSSVGIDCA